MAWYIVDKSKQGIEEFLDCIHAFHDFRLEKVEYIPGKDLVEVFLKYDTRTDGVYLRFTGVHGCNIIAERDYMADWSYRSICLNYHGFFLWIENDDFDDLDNCDIKDVLKDTTWVMSDQLFFAITDGDGKLIEDPEDWFHQTWVDMHGQKTAKDFYFKSYDDNNWQLILKPKY